MDKNALFNIIKILILVMGIASITASIIKPAKFERIKLNGKSIYIKDKDGFLKYKQKLHLGLGVLCSTASILSLLNIIENTLFCIILSLTTVVVSLLNSILIKKYS